MSGALWPAHAGDPAEFRVAITSVAQGRSEGELLYSLETDEVSGIFALNGDGVEQRLFHTADFRVRHIAPSPDGESIAASLFHKAMGANIAVVRVDGKDFFEATDGDSVDLAPRWIGGAGRRIVFQSAGVGRDAAGRVCGLAPFAIQEIDLDGGALDTLAEDPQHDLLGPQKLSDGTLYYIRRPYANAPGRRKASPVDALKEAALFPFRMAVAVFQYFNFFSMKYTGKPLATSGGAAQRHPDLKRMMIWGNLIDADRAAREHGMGDTEAPSLVPSSWQLMRQRPGAREPECVAKGVLSFDVAPDGALVYSNGSAIHRIDAGSDKRERVLVGSMIEHVAAF